MALAPPLLAASLQTSAGYIRHRTSLAMLMHMILLTTILFSNMVLAQHVVEYLPGFPGKLPFRLETGYIGTGENEEVELFYYFVESDTNPEEDPLILWLTGGPGCSGLSGFIFRIGPLVVDVDNSVEGRIPPLILNEDSWTKRANMIFLDQPAGTGFSYAKTFEASFSSDTSSAKFAYDFLRKWLIKHPKYLKNPLYICGDSYSGIFVPSIVKEVYDGIEAGDKPLLNMKGFILGNPYTDWFIDGNEKVPYTHRMGLLSDELYKSAEVHCNGNYLEVDPDNVLCLSVLERINECLDKIDPAHILEPSCGEDIWRPKRNVLLQYSSPEQRLLGIFLPTERFPCRVVTYSLVQIWANYKSVQKALNIREGTLGEWVRCNKSIQNSDVASENIPYQSDIQSTVPYHKHLTNKRCRGLIYSGDHDMKVPHSSTKNWIDSLEVPIQSDWRPWFVGGQIAGYTVTYADRDFELTFATVKGAGHTAPEYKEVECFSMIDRWFGKSPL